MALTAQEYASLRHMEQALDAMNRGIADMGNILGRMADAQEAVAAAIVSEALIAIKDANLESDDDQVPVDENGRPICNCDLDGKPCVCDCGICQEVQELQAQWDDAQAQQAQLEEDAEVATEIRKGLEA